MNHIVYLDHKAKEFENLRNGTKSMIVRGASGRKMPYGRVFENDVLYFIENNGEGFVKAKAIVKQVINSEKLEKEQSVAMIENNMEALLLNSVLKKKYSGKRYLVLIEISDFELIDPFEFNRNPFLNKMDDWLPFDAIMDVKK